VCACPNPTHESHTRALNTGRTLTSRKFEFDYRVSFKIIIARRVPFHFGLQHTGNGARGKSADIRKAVFTSPAFQGFSKMSVTQQARRHTINCSDRNVTTFDVIFGSTEERRTNDIFERLRDMFGKYSTTSRSGLCVKLTIANSGRRT